MLRFEDYENLVPKRFWDKWVVGGGFIILDEDGRVIEITDELPDYGTFYVGYSEDYPESSLISDLDKIRIALGDPDEDYWNPVPVRVSLWPEPDLKLEIESGLVDGNLWSSYLEVGPYIFRASDHQAFHEKSRNALWLVDTKTLHPEIARLSEDYAVFGFDAYDEDSDLSDFSELIEGSLKEAAYRWMVGLDSKYKTLPTPPLPQHRRAF